MARLHRASRVLTILAVAGCLLVQLAPAAGADDAPEPIAHVARDAAGQPIARVIGLPGPAVAAWSILPGGGQFALGQPVKGTLYLLAFPALAVGADLGLQAMLLSYPPTTEEALYLGLVGTVVGWGVSSLVSGVDAGLTASSRTRDVFAAEGAPTNPPGEPSNPFQLAVVGLSPDGRTLPAGTHRAMVESARGVPLLASRVHWSYAGAIAPDPAHPGSGDFVATSGGSPATGSVTADAVLGGTPLQLSAVFTVAGMEAADSGSTPKIVAVPSVPVLPPDPVIHHHAPRPARRVLQPPPARSIVIRPAPITASAGPTPDDRIMRAYQAAGQGDFLTAYQLVAPLVTSDGWGPKSRYLMKRWGPQAATQVLMQAESDLSRRDRAAVYSDLARLTGLTLTRAQGNELRGLLAKARRIAP